MPIACERHVPGISVPRRLIREIRSCESRHKKSGKRSFVLLPQATESEQRACIFLSPSVA